MNNEITGKEYLLSKMFDYHIPTYQRSYAWSHDKTETLFDDLYNFYE